MYIINPFLLDKMPSERGFLILKKVGAYIEMKKEKGLSDGSIKLQETNIIE